ncbi:MAG: carbohydrate porin [Planctomycetes bacterium]|nr:carbohydrate porin [Planctomycetota bacterium]
MTQCTREWTRALGLAAALVPLASAQAAQQDELTLEQRIARLEARNGELERQLGIVADELEAQELGSVLQPLGRGVSGMGPAASKVYQSPGGVSLGGYGEALFTNLQGSTDTVDALRTVLYVGYKFNDEWLFNSEIEFEHGEAGESLDGKVAVEFAYLDGRLSDAVNVRTGLLLVPMGFVNERHEPTTFLSTNRPFVERVILPATWREIGAGLWGSAGSVDWRAYVINGMDADGFKASGLRGGRQNGAEALAEDLAIVARADWHALEGLDLSCSAYWGDSGQDNVGLDVPTFTWEAHAEARWRSFALRALYAQTKLDDVAALNNARGFTGAASVGEELFGGYVEVACDVLSLAGVDSKRSLEPFVRYEAYDTQADVPDGFASDPKNDIDVLTMGVVYRPTDAIVFKLDYSDFDNQADNAIDRLTLGMGFVF